MLTNTEREKIVSDILEKYKILIDIQASYSITIPTQEIERFLLAEIISCFPEAGQLWNEIAEKIDQLSN